MQDHCHRAPELGSEQALRDHGVDTAHDVHDLRDTETSGLLSGYFGIPTTSNFPFVSTPGQNGNLSERALKLLAFHLTLNQRVRGSSPCGPTKILQIKQGTLRLDGLTFRFGIANFNRTATLARCGLATFSPEFCQGKKAAPGDGAAKTASVWFGGWGI